MSSLWLINVISFDCPLIIGRQTASAKYGEKKIEKCLQNSYIHSHVNNNRLKGKDDEEKRRKNKLTSNAVTPKKR